MISGENATLKGCMGEVAKAAMYRKGQSGEGDVKKGLRSNQPATERPIGSIVL